MGELEASRKDKRKARNKKTWLYISHPKYGFPGVIDEVRIYNKVLTADEIKEHYEEGICEENWEVAYGDCQPDNKRIKYYVDLNSCGTTYNLPSDNGTYEVCDYCTPNWQPQNTSCLPNFGANSKTLNSPIVFLGIWIAKGYAWIKMKTKKVLIMGAAGRDFHNFNVFFRDKPEFEVVAFTAAQLPGIANRKYPPELAGKLYPEGVPIYDEKFLPELIEKYKVDVVVLAYSDLSHDYVMQRAERVLSCGADFWLLGPKSTMLKSRRPVISVCAVRTGCGKSEVSRYMGYLLRRAKKKYVVVRHPMPYGVLKNQIWERIEDYQDLVRYKCTVEEREEYEPHIERGEVVYAGVDYGEILRRAEKEAEIIIWDGGNNDLPFYKPDLHIVLVDPLRPGHEVSYYPGEANLMMADVVVVNKESSAREEDIKRVKENVRRVNPRAKIVDGDSVISVKEPRIIEGKKVVVVEDGPTLTHGGMSFGAGTIAAKKHNAELVDPRKFAVGSIREVYRKFKQLGPVLPAMGYSPEQLRELEETINRVPADAAVIGTPIRLNRLLNLNKPAVRVIYEFKDVNGDLKKAVMEWLEKI